MVTGPRADIIGIGIDGITHDQLLDKVSEYVRGGSRHVLSFANPEIVMMARKRREYRDFLENADLVLADGIGLVWASRIIGNPIPERITGTDFMHDIAVMSQSHGYKLYFLGGAPGVAEVAATNLSLKYPGARVVGCHHGYFSEAEERDILRNINAAKPDILVVCLGMYRQEMWIRRNQADLAVPVCFGNGGALDFAAGKAKRAPAWMIRFGLEWLYRLLRQPSRMKRQASLPYFALQVLLQGRRG